jgi:hypothetical protein
MDFVGIMYGLKPVPFKLTHYCKLAEIDFSGSTSMNIDSEY